MAFTESECRALFRGCNDAVLLVDAQEDAILEANPQAQRLLGFTHDELLSRGISDIHPHEMHKFRLFASEVQDEGVAWTDELRCRTKSGSTIPAEISAAVVWPRENRYIITMIRDISKRIDERNARVEMESYYRDVYEQAPVALFQSTSKGIIQDVNPAGASMLGYRHEQIIGTYVLNLYSDTEAGKARASECLKRFQRGDAVGDEELEMLRADGSTCWVSLSINAIHNADGTVVASRGACIDITARKSAEHALRRLARRLETLHDIDRAIIGKQSPETIADAVTRHIRDLIPNLRSCVAAVDLAKSEAVVFASETAYETQMGAGFRTTVQGAGVTDNLIEGSPHVVPDLLSKTEPLSEVEQSFVDEGLRSFLRVPLLSGSEFIGFLNLASDEPGSFNEEYLQIAQEVAEVLSIALKLRDSETRGHTRRVADSTIKLARALDDGTLDLDAIYRGALVHDIGKMAIPDRILHKPGPLTEEEWEVMKQHPRIARDMLAESTVFSGPLIDIPYAHHEKWNGTGYPEGLDTVNIPYCARIFSLIDVWDALTSDRPYRSAWSREKTASYIEDHVGTHFDPDIPPVFLQLVQSGM